MLRPEYPWDGAGKGEVVVHIPTDPLGHTIEDWTCILDRNNIEETP